MRHQNKAYLVDKSELRRWIEDGLKKAPAKAVSEDVTAVPINGEKPSSIPGAPDAEEATPDSDAAVNGPGNATTLRGREDAVEGEAMGDRAPKEEELPAPDSLAPTPQPEQPITRLMNESVLCKHGRADPRKPEQLKRVSEVRLDPSSYMHAAVRLTCVSVGQHPGARRYGSVFGSASGDSDCILSAVRGGDRCRSVPSRSALRVCRTVLITRLPLSDHLYAREHPENVRQFDQANQDRSGTTMPLLSSAWLKGEKLRARPPAGTLD